jgi:hypothetical protein
MEGEDIADLPSYDPLPDPVEIWLFNQQRPFPVIGTKLISPEFRVAR